MSEPFLSPSWHRVANLRPRLRGHAQVHRHRYRGEAWYVVQDDLSGRFHRFTPSVYLFVGMMDGLNRYRFQKEPQLLVAWESARHVLSGPQAAKEEVPVTPPAQSGEVKPAA